MYGLFLYLLTYLIDKLRLKIYFLKGEVHLVVFIHVRPIFIFANVFDRQITFENILPQRREVVVSGDGNYFYRANAH